MQSADRNRILAWTLAYNADTTTTTTDNNNNVTSITIISILSVNFGDSGGTVVKVLCYKSEGRWFDPSWCHWNFSLT